MAPAHCPTRNSENPERTVAGDARIRQPSTGHTSQGDDLQNSASNQSGTCHPEVAADQRSSTQAVRHQPFGSAIALATLVLPSLTATTRTLSPVLTSASLPTSSAWRMRVSPVTT